MDEIKEKEGAVSSFSHLFGGKETGYTAHPDNTPDPDFDSTQARKRICALRKLIRFASSMGYEFGGDDEYRGNCPQDEIKELKSKMFIGPRRVMGYAWNDPFYNNLIDQVFKPSNVFKYLREPHATSER